MRAVAVMDVEIDHGHPLGAMSGAGVQRRDRDRVEQAEAHGPRRLGMMAGRAYGAESVVGFACHDLIDCVDGGACCAQRRLPASRRDDCIGIEPFMVALGNGGADHLHIGLRMQALDDGEVSERRLLALQRPKRRGGERIVDGAQTIRLLRMTVARIVQQAGGVGEEEGGHQSRDGGA